MKKTAREGERERERWKMKMNQIDPAQQLRDVRDLVCVCMHVSCVSVYFRSVDYIFKLICVTDTIESVSQRRNK